MPVIAPMTFEEGLYQQLQTLPKWTLLQARLVRLIEHAPMGTTPRAVVALEERVRTKLNIGPDVTDWANLPTTFDWNTILQLIEQLLPLIISLFGGL